MPAYAPPKTLPRFTPVSLPLSSGYAGTFLAFNDSAQAVGLEESGSTSFPIYYSGGSVTNLQSALGNGYLDSIDQLGQAVGQGGGKPVFYPGLGGSPITLNIAGTANSIALGPLVGVTTTGSAGQSVAELWQPYSDATITLGNARLSGVDVSGWAFGQADNGNAWYAVPGTGGTITSYDLDFKGALRGANDFDWAWGYRLAHGRQTPILADFSSPTAYKLTDFKLSAGYHYGSLLSVNDDGFAVGIESKTAHDFRSGLGVSVAYPYGPDRPLLLSTALDLPSDVTLGAVGTLSENNFLGGFATFSRSVRPEILQPLLRYKLAGLHAILAYDDGLLPSEWDELVDDIDDIENDVVHGQTAEACGAVSDVGSAAQDAADYLDDYYGDDAAEAVDTFDDVDEALGELYDELACTPSFQPHLLGLAPEQSAFYGTSLSPLSSPSTSITTTVGPPTVTSP